MKNNLINKLEEKKDLIQEKLIKRREDMVNQDSSNESRYITATRWAVEQEIEKFDKDLIRITKGINEIKKIVDNPKRWSEKYFVSDNYECIELGIISKNTKVGQEILEKNGFII
ncbi:hypothetical protein CO009_00955 [Candidatus Shapirobacteria bacterium CG_4_8_14_3_um_filter_35_11]|nr:MAG: hypothetical protein AUK05_02865 [Candidatus Shapirobacteria bacterium CG2_30_35_20]PIV07390.1 MAG: hypothetical protein COS53_02480 [Candidatus Shapirobacteria bacterium CG03_land_8_20_14_0_80_35_14]PJC80845.1 MAG: hypothetical protein CO009_00955 [Candidatus Shapirobacteria bacterium CG_4_8_14_3_um_filter_35_11]